MYSKFKIAAVAVLAAAAGAVHADPAETKGGIKIKTDDGRFEANIGGRIQFDGNVISTDDKAVFGSNSIVAGAPVPTQNDGFFFRRIYLTLKGKAYGWNYKIEPDFAGQSSAGQAVPSVACTSTAVTATPATPTVSCTGSNLGREISFQDVYISTQVGPGEIIFGQIKPFRGMEELTSSNDILMMERPFASGNGIFNGGVQRDFQDGVFYKGEFLGAGTYGLGGYSLRKDATASNQGVGANGRVTFAPVLTDNVVLHTGLSYSTEAQDSKGASDVNAAASAIGSGVRYLSRRGPSLTLGTAAGTTRNADTVGGELAGKFGPAYFQAEYMTQKLGQLPNVADQYVNAWYVQASYFITGESKTYKKSDGFFGSSIKPNSSYGAFEVKARYDRASNDALAITGQTYGKASASAITGGVNWYANPNVRFMLEYTSATAERRVTASGAVQKDEPNAVAARAQFSF